MEAKGIMQDIGRMEAEANVAGQIGDIGTLRELSRDLDLLSLFATNEDERLYAHDVSIKVSHLIKRAILERDAVAPMG